MGFFEIFRQVYLLLTTTAIFWLPLLLLYVFTQVWLNYVRAIFRSKIDWTLLEIKLPKEIIKTPQAMELVLHAFHQTRDGTKLQQWFEGLVRAWFSLEIVSIEGRVHFFIYTQRFFVDLIESQIYSQYPEVEIVEVDDYTKYVNFGAPDSDWFLFGSEFKLTKPDPYPIKTYFDYELDKEKKDDRQLIDPITPLIELFGSMGQGEQLWMQIPMQAAKNRFLTPGRYFKRRGWKDEGDDLVKKLTKRDAKPPPGQDFVNYAEQMLSPGERNTVEAIERSISKYGFDCGMRILYLAKKDKFRELRKPSLVGSVKQFNSHDRNGFKPDGRRITDFDYPWEDFRGMRLSRRRRVIFDAYIRRSWFYPPYPRKPFTLSVEELATLYHFPGSVAETPTFTRIPSKSVEPPSNLPV
tara:strand:+ start:2012 stop:3238 length:1227 start_codon:yes stop_codon:yes gene_type:complete